LIIIGAILAVSWFTASILRAFYCEQMRLDIAARALPLNRRSLISLLYSVWHYRIFATGQAGRQQPGSRLLPEPVRVENHAILPELINALQGEIGSAVRYSQPVAGICSMVTRCRAAGKT
jgi:hypothetical protein